MAEETKENKIFFNSNISVDMIKVSRDPNISFEETKKNKNKVESKTCLWTDFSSGVNANYFSQEASALFLIYRKTPFQKYYEYVCTMGNGLYDFHDYKVSQGQFYHYLSVVRKSDGNYITYENVDENDELKYIKAVWDNWSICDLEQDINDDKVFYKTGDTWLLGLNLARESVSQNINVVSYETMGQYNKYGLGKKKYESSNFSCLLGTMHEVTTTQEDGENRTTKTNYTYTEREDFSSVYAQEIAKLEKWRAFSTNGRLKLLKDVKGNMWIIQIVGIPNYEINNAPSVLPTTISFDWEEAVGLEGVTIISTDGGE